MQGDLIRCVRCLGRKKIFKINNGYSHINTGGVEVDCPMCLGNGTIKTFEKALEDAKITEKEIKQNKSAKRNKNDKESQRKDKGQS
jgi:hypothetical protein